LSEIKKSDAKPFMSEWSCHEEQNSAGDENRASNPHEQEKRDYKSLEDRRN
jgi:hypothetical protein